MLFILTNKINDRNELLKDFTASIFKKQLLILHQKLYFKQ
jgi:hypothetical protein